MPSTRDPILMLEPSNLLEPLNLADRHGDPASPREKLPESVATGAQRIRRDSFVSADRARQPMASQVTFARRRRACLRCNGHGVAPASRTHVWRRKACAANEICPADGRKRDKAVGSGCGRAHEIRGTEAGRTQESSGSNQSVALTANPGTQPAVPDQSAPTAQDAAAGAAASCGPRNSASDDKCLEGGPAAPAPGPVPTAVPDRNSDGAPAASRTTTASPAKPRAAPQTIWELDDRTQQSVNRRATPRDTADQQTITDSNGQSARSSDRNAPDRQVLLTGVPLTEVPGTVIAGRIRTRSRTSSRRRERSGDNGQTARYGDSRQEQDLNRNSNGRRDRNEDYGRGEDRRVFGRASREDDRVIGVGPRHEGPIPIFPSLFGW